MSFMLKFRHYREYPYTFEPCHEDAAKIPRDFFTFNKIVGCGGESCVLASDLPQYSTVLLKVTMDSHVDALERFNIERKLSQTPTPAICPAVLSGYHRLRDEGVPDDIEDDGGTFDPAFVSMWLIERFDDDLCGYQNKLCTFGYRRRQQLTNEFFENVWQTQLLPLVKRLHHQVGMVHGDLRWHLQNVVVRYHDPSIGAESGIAQCRLIDFGWSRTREMYGSWSKDIRTMPFRFSEPFYDDNVNNHDGVNIIDSLDFNEEAEQEIVLLERLLVRNKLMRLKTRRDQYHTTTTLNFRKSLACQS